jgi:hypothetical protein
MNDVTFSKESVKQSVKQSVKEKELVKQTNNVTVYNSIVKNYTTWIVILVCILILSRENFLIGLLTFSTLFVSVYFVHLFSHDRLNILNVLHHYHHYNNNFFSHFIQISIELNVPIIFFPAYYFYNTVFFDVWIIMFTSILYSTIHNINYGYLRINKVHSLHHENIFTNIGPDICDVLFGTKNEENTEVEDISHYIPNAIIITTIILFLQFICLNKTYETILKHGLIIFILLITIINTISSGYIYWFYSNEISKQREKNGNIPIMKIIKHIFPFNRFFNF